ncbi:MAG: YnbE family lipoprotein [Pseudomonadota bacterium]
MLLLQSFHKAVLLMGLLGLVSACTPTVQMALPNEPININLNVKIQHEILIKVDKQLDAMFSESSGLF